MTCISSACSSWSPRTSYHLPALAPSPAISSGRRKARDRTGVSGLIEAWYERPVTAQAGRRRHRSDEGDPTLISCKRRAMPSRAGCAIRAGRRPGAPGRCSDGPARSAVAGRRQSCTVVDRPALGARSGRCGAVGCRRMARRVGHRASLPVPADHVRERPTPDDAAWPVEGGGEPAALARPAGAPRARPGLSIRARMAADAPGSFPRSAATDAPAL